MKMFRHLARIFKTVTGNEDHQSILNAISNQLESTNSDTDLIIPEMNIKQADTNWLDEWGDWFGLKRHFQEKDDDFRQRIFDVLLDPTVTIPAIVMITKRILGEDTLVVVYEPYHDVRYFNISTYSGFGHYEDEDYYRIGVIDVIVNKPITDQLVLAIMRIRAAGVSVKFTYEENSVVDMSSNDNPQSYAVSYTGGVVQNVPVSYAFDVTKPAIFSGGRQILTQDAINPFNLSVGHYDESSVELTWESVSNAKYYILYRNYLPIEQVTSTSYIDHTISPKITHHYDYQIEAVTDVTNPVSQKVSIDIN